MRQKAGLAIVVSAFVALPAAAGDLVYTPVNPSFGGSPLNSAHLLGLASAQREATASDFKKDTGSGAGTGTGTGGSTNSDADLFVRQLQGRLLSALAAQVTDAIFGENPQENGTVQFGDTTVTFDRTTDSIRLTITNATDGTVTEIVVPQLVTSAGSTTAAAATAAAQAKAAQGSFATGITGSLAGSNPSGIY